MDPNGNLSIPERRALRKGDLVVYQTEGTSHRGEHRGRVNRVGESGIVWIGTTGSRYALACDYVRRADWAPDAAPEAASGVASPEAGKDTAKAPDAPDWQEMASVEALLAQVAALTRERDEARNQLRCLAVLARDMIRRVKEVCGE